MSDNTPAAPPVPSEPPKPAQAETAAPEAPKVEETDWKAEARKWEQRAKDNKTAAEKLAEIEEASKSEAQKAADRTAAAEKKAVEAEAKVLRRDVAIEHKLSKEDAALLDTITDEASMRALAARLTPSEEAVAPGARPPKPDANQGRSGAGGPKSTADSFAEYFNSHLPGR